VLIYKDNNAITDGGAITSSQGWTTTFDGNSKVTFSDNGAKVRETVYYQQWCLMTINLLSFADGIMVTYKGNKTSVPNGAVMSYKNASITFGGNSSNAKFSGSEA